MIVGFSLFDGFDVAVVYTDLLYASLCISQCHVTMYACLCQCVCLSLYTCIFVSLSMLYWYILYALTYAMIGPL